MSDTMRNQAAEAALAKILLEASGFDLQELDHRATFLELGFDSLFLIQFTQKIKNQLKVKVTFRQLIEELPTLRALLEHVAESATSEALAPYTMAIAADSLAVPTAVPESAEAVIAEKPKAAEWAPAIVSKQHVAPESAPAIDRVMLPVSKALAESAALSDATIQPLSHHLGTMDGPRNSGDLAGLERIITQQNQLMSLQLQLLSGSRSRGDAMAAAVSGTPEVDKSQLTPSRSLSTAEDQSREQQRQAVDSPQAVDGPAVQRTNQAGAGAGQGAANGKSKTAGSTESPSSSRKSTFERFGPYKPVRRAAGGGLTGTQQQSLDRFAQRFIQRTARSREHAQKHRPHFADPRGVANYRRIWKSIVYQIVVDRSAGCKLWDIDGNEYIDIAMGFGLNLFGQSPGFVTAALHSQLERGVEVGPQSPLAGDVAQLLCDFSRKDRATFCNTGSEAVMAAIRLARTVSGKSKIVFFNKDYHGNFEEVLLRCHRSGDQLRTQPAAPGVPQSFADNAIVLEYGAHASLEIIRQRADEIAAVLIEPVQSADPFTQPTQFLRDIRELTRENDIAMIMDEVITGFRAAQGGAQEWFGVWGDMATYGKVLGGGLPIGALAGSSKYMDALDGGMWLYEDESEPTADMTFFAGTFVRHPLALAAAHQILMKIKEEGPELQQELTRKTTYLVETLNTFFAQELFPFRVAQFTSLFRFMFPGDLEYADLLYFHLLERGIFTRGWGDNCFLSTAHSERDIQRIIEAVKESCLEIRAGGFMQKPEVKQELKPAAAATPSSPRRQPATEWFPLTSAQMEVWLGCQMGGLASCAFNTPFYLRLHGDLRRQALQAAIDTVFSRHQALRVQFDKEPRQRVAEVQSWELPLTDLSNLPREQQAAELKQILDAAGGEAFDLNRGPLMKLRLMRLAERDHVLLFSVHHIVCDGWSSHTLLRELGEVYSARVEQRDFRLASAASYYDYVLGELQQDEEAQSSLEYWVAQFQQLPPPLELPTDFPRPPVKSFRGGTCVHHIEKPAMDAAKQLAARLQVSLFSLTFAAFNVLLARLSGQDDVVSTVPSAGQSTLENSNLVGHCMALLPLRSSLDGKKSFAQFVAQTASHVLDAYDHRCCTLGQIVQHLNVPRSPSRMPLVEANFNLDRDSAGIDFSGLNVEIAQTEKRAVNFDLFFNIDESEDGLRIDLDYNSDLFEPETIRRWAEHFEQLLRSVAMNPDLSIGEIPILSEVESGRLLSAWNPPTTAYDVSLSVHRMFEQHVQRAPQAVAVQFEDRSLSYGQLNSRANRLATYLMSLGVGSESLVGLHLRRSAEMVIAALAILKTGAAYVPLDPGFPKPRLEGMASDARLEFIITENALLPDCPTTTAQLVCVDRDARAIDRCSSDSPQVVTGQNSPAYVIYTSGSTGKPKGVVIPHRALTNFLLSMKRTPGLGPEDTLLGITTMSFDISILEIFLPLVCGAKLVVASQADAADGARLSTLISRSKATVMQGTPATWRMLIEAGWPGQTNLRMLCGGEALSRDLAKQLLDRGSALWNMYGPTETTIWSSVAKVENSDRPIGIGNPIENTSLLILDDNLRPVPLGVSGNLYIAGAGLALGYLHQEQLTAERFMTHPYQPAARVYDTGDVVRRWADGTLEFVGRRDQQVKIRGFRIELGEIEQALVRLPDIAQAVVVDRPADENNSGAVVERALVAYVTHSSALPLTVTEIRDELRRILPDYMLPAHIVFLDEFPLTANGKIARQRLPAPSTDRPALSAAFAEPRNPLEELVLRAFKEVVKVDRVGIHDNFFDLGGHSLLATQVVSRLAEDVPFELSIAHIFESPTVAELAAFVTDKQQLKPLAETVIPRAPRQIRRIRKV